MARYLGPKCKPSRREKTDLMTTSVRDVESKSKFPSPPGEQQTRRTGSDFKRQLRGKNLVRNYYQVLERQFRRYFHLADKMKGSTGDNLLKILESRLDNVVYRLGFAATRREARQLVSHKSMLVNGRVVNIPSYNVAPGDVVSVRERAKGQLRIKGAIELAGQREHYSWLAIDEKAMAGIFKELPDVSELPSEFMMNLIVELYSK